jgi:hypothetical protein
MMCARRYGIKPTLVLACYVMNDGIYLPLDPARAKAYEDGILKLKSAVEKRGANTVFAHCAGFVAPELPL